MKKLEVLEWLSLAPADFPCWLALGALVGMWFASTLFMAIVFGIGAVICSFLACYFGMPARDELSKVTNAAKWTMYPLFAAMVVLVAGVIYVVRHGS